MESRTPVRVFGGTGGSATLAPQGEGLRADSLAVGPVWRVEALGKGALRAGPWRVRGWLEVSRQPEGLRFVNEVGMEDYVAGILGREIYPGWDLEMLKAQAVVARSYALYRRGRATSAPSPGTFDVEGTTSGQVYGGADAETPAVLSAVSATRGEYLSYQGKPILAAYHSAAGGRTASAEEVWGRAIPYLVSRPVANEEDSPDTYWRASVASTKLRLALAPLGVEVGEPEQMEVAERSESGRAIRLEIRGAEGTGEIRARALRSALGEDVIRSTLFEIRTAEAGFIFVGSGHGHGVGMSQWGGQAMAKEGSSYREILAAFYPGTRVESGASAR